jgi:hypothetical protein
VPALHAGKNAGSSTTSGNFISLEKFRHIEVAIDVNTLSNFAKTASVRQEVRSNPKKMEK